MPRLAPAAGYESAVVSECRHASEADTLYLIDDEFVCITCVADKAVQLEREAEETRRLLKRLTDERTGLDCLVGYNPGGDSRLAEFIPAAAARLKLRNEAAS